MTPHTQRLAQLAILLAILCTSVQAATDTLGLSLDFDSPDWVSAAGVTVRGAPERIDGKSGQALRFGAADALSFPSDALNLAEGTIEMDVAPQWPEGDTGRHTFFHVGDGARHITLFRANPNSLIFVYKAGMDEWHGINVKTGPWKPGVWRHLAASWRPGLDGGLVLLLDVDGVLSATPGAVVLPEKPETCWLGSRGKIEPAQAAIDNFRLHSRYAMPKPVGSAPDTVAVGIDCRAPQGPMPRPFSFTTPWNSSEYRLPFDQSHPYYRLFAKAGFEMVRLVAFSEGWLWGTEVKRDADGKIVLDFSDFDTWMDLFRSAGAEPYIRLAYHMPKALSDPNRKAGTAGYSLPADLSEWDRLMRDIVAHCNVERDLGIRYWVTMLNEADLDIRKGHANWEDMLRLYEITTRAVKETSPGSKVGGPATCGPMPGVQDEGMRQFIRFCRQRNMPPDFLCYHQYACAHPKGYETATNRVKEIVAEEWPELDAELFLDEWGLWAQDSRQNTEYAAAYHAAGVHYQIRAGVARSSIVSFNPHVPQVAQAPRRVE